MNISKETTIAEIQNLFHKSFPGLMLKFYKNKHAPNEGSLKENELDSEIKLGEILTNLKEAELNFNSEQSVADFEQHLEDNLGLHAQVFRKSNRLWLQTTATDNWTIKEQNRKGLSSIQVNKIH